MSSTTITAGDLSAGIAVASGNDGTVIIQSGLAGAKVAAISISAAGNISVLASAAPCFSAYQSTAQTIPNGAVTKIIFQTKLFDTANAFDATTNYRFQPTVAGYYQISGAFAGTTTAANLAVCYIYKNGANSLVGSNAYISAAGNISATANGIIFLNGSTDYVEIFGFQSGTVSMTSIAAANGTYFQAAMIRPA